MWTVGYNKDFGSYAESNAKSSTGKKQHGPHASVYKKQYLHVQAYILFIHMHISVYVRNITVYMCEKNRQVSTKLERHVSK